MKILYLYDKGQRPRWGSLPEMGEELQKLIDTERPDILLTREWDAPFSKPEKLLESVGKLAVPEYSLVAVNGIVEGPRHSRGRSVGCVDAVAFWKGGERKTVFVPKKDGGGTESYAPVSAVFKVPHPLLGVWADDAEDAAYSEMESCGKKSARWKDYAPESYSFERPALLSADLPGRCGSDCWFPICCDTDPVAETKDLVVYCSNGLDLPDLSVCGGELRSAGLCVGADAGNFSVAFSSPGKYGIFKSPCKHNIFKFEDSQGSGSSFVLLVTDPSSWKVTDERYFSKRGYGEVRSLGDYVAVIELAKNPLEG